MFTSEKLVEGNIYTRKGLGDRFDTQDATINTGIFQPAGFQSIWLFVTEDKIKGSTQYKDQLHGDILDWDGQTKGRKDQLIITHEIEKLELLVFYRKDKFEFPDYGFKYEGKFRYISHIGSLPVHFTLQRVIDGTATIKIDKKPLYIGESPGKNNSYSIDRLPLDTNELNSDDIEDIVLGGSGSPIRTVSWSSNRKISRADLQKAKESADFVGWQGENYVNQYLQYLKVNGTIREFEWVSSKNAISPYDFWISYDGTAKILIDVKSTRGEFERKLHVSLNELFRMREGPERYDIYRVFNVKESIAQLRIAEDLGFWANQVLRVFDGLPQGISSDSISFDPTVLRFGPVIELEIEDQTEE